MATQIGINPAQTTNAAGLFAITSEGFIQGTFQDDPAIRYQLAGGVLASTETLPMWGGCGVYEAVPAAGQDELGPTLSRATNVTAYATGQLAGFSVFNGAVNALTTPQNPCPVVLSGMGVNFFRLGSRARIIVAANSGLTSLDTGSTQPQVSWDFGGQQLAPYVAAYAANVLTAASWTGSVLTFTTTSAHGLSVGSVFTISGCTPAGYNGTFVATAGTTGSTLKSALATNPGANTVLGQLNAGGGALAVKVLRINANGKLVSYNATTGNASWAVGTTAEILI